MSATDRSVAAAPFDFHGGTRGVLLVHGFTGTPFEMRLLGEFLHRRGYTVRCPQLAGHGGMPHALAQTSWHDWYRSVETAFDELASTVEHVAVVGLSLGGLLTLELGRRRPREVAALASFAAPLWLHPAVAWTIRLLNRSPRLAARMVPKLGGSDIADAHLRQQNPRFRAYPINALGSLLDCMRHVHDHLPQVQLPVFVAHSRRDHTAPFACMNALVARIGSRDIEQLALERSYHCVTIDLERELLFTRLAEFLARHL